jgi:signal transduction histidine kinase/DNA-binding LacI/PurR family transcriptional regulator
MLGGYQETILNGIAQIAEEHHANLLSFVGAAMGDVIGSRKHWNAVYELAGPANVDGLIMFSGAIQNVTIEEFTQLCIHYAPLPVISIALKVEGIPSVTVDNSTGLHVLLKHLIEHHHYQRIAFIRGPESHPEANIRYQTYVETLESYDIPLDSSLVTPGSFLAEAGVEAVRLLLDYRKARPDVIVASNDGMAIGAWEELTRRGLSIPEDIALTGFDDIPEAKILATPLTTVRQPLIDQGKQAARMLLEWLEHGIPPEENCVTGTELVIRDSCGCLPFAIANPTASTHITAADISNNALSQRRGVVLADIQEVICPHFQGVPPYSVELLVDTFFDTLRGEDSSRFLLLFNQMLRQGMKTLTHTDLEEGIMSRWQEALSILREKALPYPHPDIAEDADKLLFRGCTLIIEATRRAHLSLENSAEASMLVHSEIVRDINATSNTQQVADYLAQNLSRLGIGTCMLALYEGTPAPTPQSRLIMAYHHGQRIALEPDEQLFPSKQLIPPNVLPQDEWPYLVIHPLVSRDIHFGFILMEMTAGQWSMYNTYLALAEQIGSALYRTLLQQQIEQSNKDLQRQAAELTEANDQLEQFAYVASHDLQEPLRMITSYLQLVEKRYKGRLDRDAEEFIGYAVDGAARMKRMINDLLAYSRVTSGGQPMELTHCDDVLANAVANLEITIKEGKALITHDPLPIVMGNSTQLAAVFQNLIGNAIKFHGEQQPRIHIAAEQKEDEWLFSIQDNGIGIASEHWEKIFAIFSRLHSQDKYPGSGIGLAICKKVVEQHGGRIWIESHPGNGTTFFFTIPKRSLNNAPLRHT